MPPVTSVVVLASSHATFLQVEPYLTDRGLPLPCRTADTVEEFRVLLATGSCDLVIAACGVPGPDVILCLEAVQQQRPDVPVILTADTIDVQQATEWESIGLWDFLLTDDRRRLPHAIRHALRESAHRRADRTAAQALREKEERYRLLFSSAADSLFVFALGPHGRPERFIDVNDAALNMLGYGRAELLERTVRDVVDPSDHARLPDDLRALVNEKQRRVEWHLLTKDGRRVPVEINGALFDVNSHPTVLGIARDISERKHFEDKLRASEARYQQILDTAQEGVWMIDADDRTTFINPKMAELLGYTADEMMGRGVCDFMDEEAAAIARVSLEGRREGRSESVERPFQRKDGSPTWALVNATPIMSRGGTYIGALAMVSDINERRNAHARMHLQSAALNAAANAIVITRRDGTIVWTNPAFADLTGYSTDEAVGQNPRALVKSGAQDAAFYELRWDTILSGHVWTGEMTNRRKDGSLYPECMTITPVVSPAGEITHFVAIKRDLTNEKGLQRQLLQAQKMESVGRLAGGIAHDFNNLLTVINGLSELALARLGEGDPLHADLQDIHQAGERAAALTRQLLAFSRKQVMVPRILNLTTLLAELRNLLQRVIGEDVTLAVPPAKSGGCVKADPGQIEQVLMNLVVNARDAMPTGGVLTIETRDVDLADALAAGLGADHPGPYVMLSISDTGTGMDDATRARLFEPFFTTKPFGKGTGLGLATVYGIIEQSGGAIAVDTAPGRGTTFRIYLPRVADVAPVSPPAAPMPVEQATETVLVVEDEEGVRHMAQRMLAPAGYSVLTAANADEALLLLERRGQPVDLMLTDVVMPGMSGPDLAVQAAGIRPNMKVVFMSGHTENAALCQSIRDELTHFIGKPFTGSELARSIRRVLDLPASSPPRAPGLPS